MRMFKRILAIVVVVLLALIGLLIGSVVVDALVGGSRIDSLVNTSIDSPNGPAVKAHVATPQADGRFPAVIMIHEFWGLKEEIVGKAQALADQGYVVVAPDTYSGKTTNWIPRAIYLASVSYTHLTLPTKRIV